MKIFLFLHKQVATYFLKFEKINTFQTLHQGVNSQRFRCGSFQL